MDRRRILLLAVGGLAAAALLAAPVVFQDQIIARVVDTLNEEIDAHVALGDGDVSVLRDFPRLNVQLHDLVVTGQGGFDGVELVRAETLGVSVDVLSLLGDDVNVKAVEVRNGVVNAIVDHGGAANWDVFGGSGGSGSASGSTSVEDIAVSGLALKYEDRQGGLTVEVGDVALTGSADMGGKETAARISLALTDLTVDDGAVTWLRKARVGVKGGVAIANDTGGYALDRLSLTVNDLGVGISGSALPRGDDWDLDLAIDSKDASFKSLLSLVPALYARDFAGLTASGALSLGGTIKGVLPANSDALPALDLTLRVEDGRFAYPDLPSDVSDVQVAASVKHPGGDPDRLAVDVSRFHLVLAGAPFDGRLKLRHPTSDPDVDLALKGRIDLATLATIVPPDPGTTLTGDLDLDLKMAGRVSAFEAQDLDAIQADGKVTLLDARYTDAEYPDAFDISRLRISVTPGALDMAEATVRFGSSDVHATGRVDNALAYALTDAPLRGRLDMTSKLLDLRPYMADDAEAEADPTASSLVAVPDNLDLTLTLKADQILLDPYDLRKVRGDVRVADSAIRLNQVKAETLGGTVTLDGTYVAPTDRRADVDMDMTLRSVDLKQSMTTVETLQTLAPVARGSTGRVTVKTKVKTALGPDLSPSLPSLMASGTVDTQQVTLQPAWLAAASKELGGLHFGGLALGDRGLGYSIERGMLDLQEAPVTIGDLDAKLSGRVGVLDESLDLALEVDIPAKGLAVGGILGEMAAAAQHKGKLPVTLTIKGTYDRPKVGVSTNRAGRAAAQAGIDAAITAAAEQGDKLIAEARKQADNLMAEARKVADRVVDEADRQAKQLVRKAKGDPIKEIAAKEGARQLRKQARTQADKGLKEARQQADKLVGKAEKKKDELVAEATEKSRVE